MEYEEPATSHGPFDEDRNPTARYRTGPVWRRMLPRQLAAWGGDDDYLEEDAPRRGTAAVVTTIALEDDAPCRLRQGGDDDPWRRMLWQLCCQW